MLGEMFGLCCLAAALPVATPESQGVPSEAILRWIGACEETAATNGFGQGFVHGFVIVRHGKVIAEGSWAPQDTLNEPHMLYSHSKSFTSTAVGFLVDDGKLDLDERVIDIFPEKAPSTPSENLRQLRVRDLLTMNVGADRTDSENDDIGGDWVRAFLANEIQRAPGTGFKYDSGATHLLAAIVERKSGLKLMDFLGERLFRPLGMASPWSTVSPTGVACGGWGMNMTTRDLAKFGQFLLQKGVWDGRRLLSSEWIDMASARQTWSGGIVVQSQTIGSGSDWAQGYGFQFWRCRHGAFRADGAAGQLTVVFPKEDAVVSVNAGLGDMQRELDLIWHYLLPAFGADALPEDDVARKRLESRCATLALPLDDSHPAVFEGMDKTSFERTEDGWTLIRDGRRLAVGDGAWKVTDWVFTDDLVEPLFGSCGTRRIAANGKVNADGSLTVSWQMLGGIRHGRFKVRPKDARVKVIFDTDMITDFDDVGALACLHAMADAGECEILATVSSTRGNASVAAIEVINGYYGRGDLPVGAPKGIGVMGAFAGAKEKVDPKSPLGKRGGGDGGHYKYRKLAADYPQWVKHLDADDAPDANEVYRKVLAAAPDHSVTICTVGFLTNLRRLLETKPDDISPLDGKALVAQKVVRWVAMACNYPSGREYNSAGDAESSRVVLENWPTPVVFSDFQYGKDCYAGRKIAESNATGPVADVFRGQIPSREDIGSRPSFWFRGNYGVGGRSAWDETAVLAAVRDAESYFNVHRGVYRMIGDKGENEWIPDEENGPHLRITEKTNKVEIGKILDELICRGPQRN